MTNLSDIQLKNDSIFISNKKVESIKLLGKGAFGEVYLYPQEFVIKFVKDPREILVLQYLDTTSISCDLIGAKLLGLSKGYFVVAMPAMSGDLSTFKITSPTELKDIMISLTKIIMCIEENNLIYTDLKLDNILYKKSDTKIHLVLGDLGGLFNTTSNIDPIAINPIPYLLYSNAKKEKVNTKIKGLYFDKTDYSILGLCRVLMQFYGKEFELVNGKYICDLSGIPIDVQNFLIKYIKKVESSLEKISLDDFLNDLKNLSMEKFNIKNNIEASYFN